MQNLTLVSTTTDDKKTTTIYDCDFVITTAGDGLWGCEAGRKVRVTSIVLNAYNMEDFKATLINVAHDSAWDIYTDSAFADAISEALNMDVHFTEQGMQDDEYASMEVYS
jgi:hypothetical protein